ncbi:MAG: hypothetical protein J6X93_05885 [Bacilli bacterium]|nr:hypothetical protein [Bacilli bacterium]
MKSFKIFWIFLVLTLALVGMVGCKNGPTPDPGEGGDGHVHSWTDWKITQDPTCMDGGEEQRTCECGALEIRPVDPIDHNYQLVKIVPATANTKGTQEHYECSMCHKLFDANKREVTSSSLELAILEGTYVSNPIVGILNAYGDIQIYDGSVEVDKGDIEGYVFGINAQGRIIYASYYSSSYGGPSDGFYHDGTYALNAGSVCGIFNIDAAFQPWPATTAVNGEQVNAWTLYDVVVPAGGYLISIKRNAANQFISDLTKNSAFVEEEDNTLFEATLADGALNNIKITITKGIKNAAVTATTTESQEDVHLTGVKVSGSAEASFALNAETGKYEGTFTLAELWNSVQFDLVYSDTTVTRMTYANTTFNGTGILSAMVDGAPYTAMLYADTEELVTNGTFFYSANAETTYDVSYDPEQETLTVNVHVNEPAGSGARVVVSGSTDAALSLNAETGKYEGQFKLTAIWQNIFFDLVDEEGSSLRLTYANTTFAGSGVLSEQASAPWTAALYSEGNEAVATGNFWYSIDKETTYIASYDPDTATMTIEVYVPEATVTEDSFVLDGTTRIAIADGVTIYDSSATDITFGEYTIAVDGDGKIFFASRTSGGYGGPGDGFYHDGNYQVVVGQVCGVFYIQEGFKSWNDCSAAERTQEVKPWSLYTRVCPENCHIITGSQSAMSNLIKAICNIDTFNESANTLFETTIADGTLTVVITFEFKE